MMSLGPLVPRNNDPRDNDPRGDVSLSSEASRGQAPGEPVEFLRPIGSSLYNVLPPQESMLRETPIYDAVGRIAVNKADSNLVAFKDSAPDTDYVYEQSDLDTEVRIL